MSTITAITGYVTSDDLGCDPCLATWVECVQSALREYYPDASIEVDGRTDQSQDSLRVWSGEECVASGQQADEIVHEALRYAWEKYQRMF